MKIYPIEGADWKLDKGDELFPWQPKHPMADFIVGIIEAWDHNPDCKVPEPGTLGPVLCVCSDLETDRREDRRALEMWAWQRATYREIAEEFGLADRPSGYYRVQRALGRLKEEITNHEDI